MALDRSVICPQFVGREQDLQVLDGLIAQAEQGQGRIALISGEAGIGKSRLVQEAKSRAAGRVLLLEGRCFQNESAVPYAPLVEMLRNALARAPLTQARRALGPAAPELTKLLPELGEQARLSTEEAEAEQDKRRLFEALQHGLLMLAGERPALLILEDLHWCDPTSLEFLLLLARRIPVRRMLLVLTYRSDETTPELTHFLAELDRGRLSTELALQRMGLSEVDTMLRLILERDVPISKEFMDIILPLSEGNPFFIEEILKALIADGDIFYANGTWDRKEISQLRIPRTIRDAVGRRTAQLDERTQRALTLASVMGRGFDFRLLQEMLETNEAELLEMLKKLVQAQLVVEESADTFFFRHALTREAVYARLMLRERQGLHRQVGEAIQRLFAGSIEQHLAELSYHFHTGADWSKSLEYSRRAGDQARTLFAPREAIVFYSRALVAARELKTGVDPALLGARGHAYEILGDFKSALNDFEQALHIAREQRDGRAEWQTLMSLGFLWQGRDYQQTGEYFRQARQLAEGLGEPRLLAHSLNRLGNWSVNTGDTAGGLEAHRMALGLLEQDVDEKSTADTRDLMGMAAQQHGDPRAAFDHYQEAIRLYRKLGDKRGLVSTLLGSWHAYSWDETDILPSRARPQVLEMALEALELARETDWPAAQSYVQWALCIGLANMGRFGEALERGEESLRIAQEIEHRQWIAAAEYALGHASRLLLQAGPAIERLEMAFALGLEMGSDWWSGCTAADLAMSYLLQNDIARAEALLDSTLKPHAGHLRMVERRMLWAQGHLRLAQGRPEEALQVAQRLIDSRTTLQGEPPIPHLLKLRGQARLALGQMQGASQDLERARQTAEERSGFAVVWQIRELLVELHEAEGRPEATRGEAIEARRLVEELARSIPEQGLRKSFLQAAGRKLPKEAAPTGRQSEAARFGGLTRREREIARCLSLGLSNREIAEGLVLSERTVENHVANILRKLRFESRAQIAVWVVEKGLGEEN